MAYININEYDNTVVATKSYSDNIVAIPINASDGPSDRWITCYTYDEFIQTFGSNPDPGSLNGNSWEYATNLLLRGMPVCVRRITHFLDEDGQNSEILLPDVDTAKAIVKIKATVDSESSKVEYSEEELNVVTNNYSLNDTIVTLQPNPLHVYSEDTEISTNKFYKNRYFMEKDVTSGSPEGSIIEDESFALIAGSSDLVNNYPFERIDNNSGYRFVGPRNNAYLRNSDVIEAMENEIKTTTTDIESWYNGLADATTNDIAKMTKYEDLINYNPVGNPKDFVVVYGGDVDNNKKQLLRCDYNAGIPNPNYLGTIEPTYEFVDADEHKFALVTKNTKVLRDKGLFEINAANPAVVNIRDDSNYEPSVEMFFTIYNHENPNDAPTLYLNDSYKNLQLYKGAFKTVTAADDALATELTNAGITFTLVAVNPTASTFSDRKLYLFDIRQNQSEPFTEVNDVKIKDIFSIANFAIMYDVTLNKTPGYYTTINWTKPGDILLKSDVVIPRREDAEWYLKTINYDKLSNAEYNDLRLDVKVPTTGAVNHNYIYLETKVRDTGTSFKCSVDNKAQNISKDITTTKIQGGIPTIVNNYNQPVGVYLFRLTQVSTTDNIGISSVIYTLGIDDVNRKGVMTYSSLFKIYDKDNNDITDEIEVMEDASSGSIKYFIELQPGDYIKYNKNLNSCALDVDFAILNDQTAFQDETKGSLDISMLSSRAGRYEFNYYLTKLDATKYYIKDPGSEIVDYDDVPINDNRGNFNLFIAEYLYPGIIGNSIKVKISTIARQGIYAYVYRGNQYLERLELCSFRERLANGKVNILDTKKDIQTIWRLFLLKFGVLYTIQNDEDDSESTGYDDLLIERMYSSDVYGNYIKLRLNPNLVKIGIYDYIESILAQNEKGSTLTSLSGGKNPLDEDVKHEVPNCYSPLKDKYKYDIKFVTGGSFVDDLVYSDQLMREDGIRLIEDALLDLVEDRKDCVAYLDIPKSLPVEDVPYYFEHLSTSYAAAYDPWCRMYLASGSTKWMPPSFVQLYTHAKSIQSGNKLYLPPAGVQRGIVNEVVQVQHELPSKYITEWQTHDSPQFINPIFYINGYDYTVYGQKTLYNVVSANDKFESALQNLNVRLVANEIKKLIFRTCLHLTFELNNILTWNEFKSRVETTLSAMQGEGVLTNYSVLMGSETMTLADLNTGHICGTVSVSIASAATDWDIDFELQPNLVTFNEVDYNSTYSM